MSLALKYGPDGAITPIVPPSWSGRPKRVAATDVTHAPRRDVVVGATGGGPAESCPERSTHVRRSGPLLWLVTAIRPARRPHGGHHDRKRFGTLVPFS